MQCCFETAGSWLQNLSSPGLNFACMTGGGAGGPLPLWSHPEVSQATLDYLTEWGGLKGSC